MRRASCRLRPEGCTKAPTTIPSAGRTRTSGNRWRCGGVSAAARQAGAAPKTASPASRPFGSPQSNSALRRPAEPSSRRPRAPARFQAARVGFLLIDCEGWYSKVALCAVYKTTEMLRIAKLGLYRLFYGNTCDEYFCSAALQLS